ncbi:MAG TPA: glycosyltransferase family 2 protein [Candidatus Saccharimonadales bacterium]|nr:glycosyltransferase family 2 protein [Candidatus Saccharimonadales bacterium]
MKSEQSKLISVIIPVKDEQDGLVWLHETLIKSLKSLKPHSFEVIYVNDGSVDKSQEVLQSLKPQEKISVQIIEFSRNFGKEAALSAGLAICKGDGAIFVDADGQYPVELIGKFIEKWQRGADVVIGVRDKNQKEGFVKRYGSKAYYSITRQISEREVVPKSTDFRLVDRKVIDEFNKFKENDRIARGLIDWLGYRRDYVYFDANERKFGKASYNFKKLTKTAINSFVSLSAVPLYISGYVGLLFIFLGTGAGLFWLIEQVILGDPMRLHITGTAVLGFVILFLVGMVLAAQGLIGVYIARVLNESQGRPLYVVRQITKN